MPFRTGLLGKKVGMTSIFTATGDRAPVTAVHAGPCVVLDKITPDKNGYAAVKLGFGEKPLRRTTKPELGLFTKAKTTPQRFVREVRLEAGDLEKFPEVGQPVPLATVFKALSYIDVEGTSKGKGFQGVMKRHHMPGFRATHGTHEFFRHGGSIGCRLTPGRVHKGKRMSGLMGNVKNTASDLVVVKVLDDKNVVLVKGAIPGARNGYVVIRNAKKKTGVKVKLKGQGEPEVKSKNPMKASKAGAGSAKPAAAKPAKK
jgi:large subunit ribosomal protein L3